MIIKIQHSWIAIRVYGSNTFLDLRFDIFKVMDLFENLMKPMDYSPEKIPYTYIPEIINRISLDSYFFLFPTSSIHRQQVKKLLPPIPVRRD